MHYIADFFVAEHFGLQNISSLEYKHVMFRKLQCSATQKLGVDCVWNIVKIVWSLHKSTAHIQNVSSTKRLHTKRLYTQRLLNKTSP
jgi:hypothetical protein